MSLNWVMVPSDLSRPFIPLPRERILFTSPASTRTSFSLKTPDSSSSNHDPTTTVDIVAAGGIAYLTTSRLVFLARPATPTFTSFSAPLLNLSDSRVTAPFFGPNVLVAEVKPVREGGIPTQNPVELRLTFKDGGAYDFHARFCEVRERVMQAREIAREIDGQNAAGTPREVHGEQLPAYESVGTGLGQVIGQSVASEGADGRAQQEHQQSLLDDDEPPPFSLDPSRPSAAQHRDPHDGPPPDYEEVARS